MNTTRNCGCKGYRTCLICENTYQIQEKVFLTDCNDKATFVYCPWCNKAWEGTDNESYKRHPNHSGRSIHYPGVLVQTDFITPQEEVALMKGIDELPWDPSQSGRRKQNFGPKANFKKKKVNIGNFKGFPDFSKFVQEKFETVPLLRNYKTIEQCSLEYDPSRGASIEPHIDDCWIWGERIVTVNCLSDSVLTMTPYKGGKEKYNLNEHDVKDRLTVIESEQDCNEDIVVKIPMPRRSLIVMYGSARYDWEHCVLREDIKERRVCVAYREFTPPYLPGGEKENVGRDILNVAATFWDHKQVKCN